MQKLLSLLIVVLLMALPVCAEETAPAEEGGWLDAETGEYGPDKYAIRRYQKSGGEYRQKSKFNISSAEQARKIVDALSGWLADA